MDPRCIPSLLPYRWFPRTIQPLAQCIITTTTTTTTRYRNILFQHFSQVFIIIARDATKDGTPAILPCHSSNEANYIHGAFSTACQTRPAVPNILDSRRITSLQHSLFCNGPPSRRRRRRSQLGSIILRARLAGHNEQGLRRCFPERS